MAEPFQPIGAVAVNVLSQADVPIFPRVPGVAKALARHLARRAVESQLQAQGFLVVHVPYTQVRELAQAHLSAHPELLDQAAEIVRTDPKLRAMAEKEERQRQRNERKMRKGGVSDRPVT